VTHGVAFSVDGTVVNWSDTSHEPLAPGQSRSVTANNGPLGKGTWTCADGTFLVVAKVDDVNRIDESDKSNNTAKAVLTTGSGADLVVTSVRVDGDALAGKPVKLVGTVKNAGTRPTPEKVTVSCTFVAKDESGKAVSVGYGVLHRALGPGESADVPIERPWVPMAAGKYAVRGIADDVNRIAETNEANNASEAVTIEVK
jgi:subtilase family serine protease